MKTQTYEDADSQSFSVESVKVCKFKAHGAFFPWKDSCEFVFFLFFYFL